MKVYIMVGLIGSGKSSWARMTAGSNFQTIRVSCDDIRDMIKDRYIFDLQLESTVRAMSFAMVEQALKEGFNVVCDECYLTAEHRTNLCEELKVRFGDKVDITYVWVHCDPSTALQRRLTNLRGQPSWVWKQVMKKMVKVFEKPSVEENEFVTEIIILNND